MRLKLRRHNCQMLQVQEVMAGQEATPMRAQAEPRGGIAIEPGRPIKHPNDLTQWVKAKTQRPARRCTEDIKRHTLALMKVVSMHIRGLTAIHITIQMLVTTITALQRPAILIRISVEQLAPRRPLHVLTAPSISVVELTQAAPQQRMVASRTTTMASVVLITAI